MNALRFVCQRNICQLRQFHKCIVQQTEAAATNVDMTPKPSYIPSAQELQVDSKIEKIADQIVTLNLIEVAQLSELLKKRLNLPDAPMMPMGGFVAASKVEQEEEEPQVLQSSFSVKLKGFDEAKKVALIKELKSILPDCNLVQAKKFVESAPAVVKAELSKDEAEKLKETIEKVGGQVEIV